MPKALITVVTPCYNEESNVAALYKAIRDQFARLPQHGYRHLFIDNASTDGTADILRGLAANDPNVQVIVNTRNFGHVRSPYHALLQAEGDAVIVMAADFQDPPELIPSFVERWAAGDQIVLGVKEQSDENGIVYWLRSRYYSLLESIAEVQIVQHATGFGMFDRAAVEAIRRIADPYPFFRGQLAEIGYRVAKIPYRQPRRRAGITSQNFYSLFDIALLGVINHSKVPLRLATLAGFALGTLSLLVALGYFVAKLVFWRQFELGLAPILIGFFFVSSVQLFFLGVVGEYIGSIWTQIRQRPHVFERERLNFGDSTTRADATVQ